MDRGANVVKESRQRQLEGAAPAADSVLRLQHRHRPSGSGQGDGCRQAVRSRADDDGIVPLLPTTVADTVCHGPSANAEPGEVFLSGLLTNWLRRQDSNLRPSG